MGLRDFGVPESIESGYLILRQQGPIDPDSLRVWLPGLDVDDVLRGFKEFGLAEEAEDGRWVAEDPQAVATRFRERTERLASDLEEAADSPLGVVGSIEVLRGIQTINGFVKRRTNESDLVQGFDLPPYINLRDDPEQMNAEGLRTIAPEWGVLDRGGRLQSVYDPSGYRGDPTKIKEISSFVAAGEEAKVAEVHTKLIIFDRVEVLVGFLRTYEKGDPENVLAMRTDHPIMVEALCAQFDTAWKKGTPWSDPESRTDADMRRSQLIRYLLSAFDKNDIAADLEVSPRTVDREIHNLMSYLGVEPYLDRFFSGVQVGLKLASSQDTTDADAL